jgi:hypothetical protein
MPKRIINLSLACDKIPKDRQIQLAFIVLPSGDLLEGFFIVNM